MTVEKISCGSMDNNAYVVWDEQKVGVVIDAPQRIDRVCQFVADNGIKIEYLLLTHGHYDHILGADKLCGQTGAKIVIAKADEPMLHDVEKATVGMLRKVELPHTAVAFYAQGDKTITVGDLSIGVIDSPGHTPGGVIYQIGDYLFTGDSLFKGTIGRCDFPGGSFAQLLNSIEGLRSFGEHTKVCPGHGENSTLGYEFAHNPYYNGGQDGDIF